MSLIKKYFWNILVSIDQFANTLFGGDPDSTLSSRFHGWNLLPHNTWRWRVGYSICSILHLLDPNHCKKSYEPDEGDDAVIKDVEK